MHLAGPDVVALDDWSDESDDFFEEDPRLAEPRNMLRLGEWDRAVTLLKEELERCEESNVSLRLQILESLAAMFASEKKWKDVVYYSNKLLDLHKETGSDSFLVTELQLTALSELGQFSAAEKIVDQLLREGERARKMHKELNAVISVKAHVAALHLALAMGSFEKAHRIVDKLQELGAQNLRPSDLKDVPHARPALARILVCLSEGKVPSAMISSDDLCPHDELLHLFRGAACYRSAIHFSRADVNKYKELLRHQLTPPEEVTWTPVPAADALPRVFREWLECSAALERGIDLSYQLPWTKPNDPSPEPDMSPLRQNWSQLLKSIYLYIGCEPIKSLSHALATSAFGCNEDGMTWLFLSILRENITVGTPLKINSGAVLVVELPNPENPRLPVTIEVPFTDQMLTDRCLWVRHQLKFPTHRPIQKLLLHEAVLHVYSDASKTKKICEHHQRFEYSNPQMLWCGGEEVLPYVLHDQLPPDEPPHQCSCNNGMEFPGVYYVTPTITYHPGCVKCNLCAQDFRDWRMGIWLNEWVYCRHCACLVFAEEQLLKMCEALKGAPLSPAQKTEMVDALDDIETLLGQVETLHRNTTLMEIVRRQFPRKTSEDIFRLQSAVRFVRSKLARSAAPSRVTETQPTHQSSFETIHPHISLYTSQQGGINFVELLPRELSLYIFSLLSPGALCNVRLVARKWLNVADDDSIWKAKYCELYGEARPPGVIWKTAFENVAQRLSEVRSSFILIKYRGRFEFKPPPVPSSPVRVRHHLSDNWEPFGRFKVHPASNTAPTVGLGVTTRSLRDLLFFRINLVPNPDEAAMDTVRNPKMLKIFIRRYCQFMALKAKNPAVSLVPSQDIEIVWQSHLIRPVKYREDCERLWGRVVEHKMGLSLGEEVHFLDSLKRTEELWAQAYKEPYSVSTTTSDSVVLAPFHQNRLTRLVTNSDVSYQDFSLLQCVEFLSSDSYEMENILERWGAGIDEWQIPIQVQPADIQKDFSFDAKYILWCKDTIERYYGSLWSVKLGRTLFGPKELKGYEKFLYLLAKHPGAALCPTYSIVLAWHAHMMNPIAYEEDCMRLFGRVIDHEPWPKPVEFVRCRQLWQEEFGSAIELEHILSSDPKKCVDSEHTSVNQSEQTRLRKVLDTLQRKQHVISPATLSLSAAKPKDAPKTLEEAITRGICTFVVTGVHFRNQEVFSCLTCEQTQDDGVCVVCAQRCHSGHNLRPMGVLEFFCDCGAEGESCNALPH